MMISHMIVPMKVASFDHFFLCQFRLWYEIQSRRCTFLI